ncbi:MAG TPA: hypothetical protein VGY58_00700, partial [Gemmataceae bacterium]|nr:hypothetical protein [Gemmataceae bacterium]
MRAVHCYAWEGYHAGDNVYLSRETRKWVRELVGTIDLQEFETATEVHDDLICLVFEAIVGGSRLPLTSVEAPLPGFSLGDLAYFHRLQLASARDQALPMSSFRDLIEQGLHAELNRLEKIKLLEAVLRTTPAERIPEAAQLFVTRWRALGHDDASFLGLCRSLFNEVALSPFTDFVDKALALIDCSMRALGAQTLADLLSYLIRQTVRHLTAYDLITFHHRGANYPDALLLDSLLERYVAQINSESANFLQAAADESSQERRKRLRRRALRQGWLIRRAYEGLPVPDAPTSPGENSRVLPAPHQRVPEEQILQADARKRRLYEVPTNKLLGSISVDAALRLCAADLEHPEEMQELGMAVFLDRPLGASKAPGEPDRTLLLSYEMWSASIAERRLQMLFDDPHFPAMHDREAYRDKLRRLQVPGVPLKTLPGTQRPGAVSLADAAKVASDWVLLRTTRQTVQAFLELFDFAALGRDLDVDYLDPSTKLLIVSAVSVGEAQPGVLLVYDGQLRRRLELQI